MRKRIFLLVLLPFLAVAETWLPPERPLPDLTDLAKRNEIVAESPRSAASSRTDLRRRFHWMEPGS